MRRRPRAPIVRSSRRGGDVSALRSAAAGASGSSGRTAAGSLWHELPRARWWQRSRRERTPPPWVGREPAAHGEDANGGSRTGGDDFVPTLLAELRAFFAGNEVAFTDVELDLEELTPLGRASLRAPHGSSRRGRHLRRARRAGRPARRRARCGHVLRAEPSRVFVPCHRVSAPAAGSLGAVRICSGIARDEAVERGERRRSRAPADRRRRSSGASSRRSRRAPTATAWPSSRASSTRPGARTCMVAA